LLCLIVIRLDDKSRLKRLKISLKQSELYLVNPIIIRIFVANQI